MSNYNAYYLNHSTSFKTVTIAIWYYGTHLCLLHAANPAHISKHVLGLCKFTHGEARTCRRLLRTYIATQQKNPIQDNTYVMDLTPANKQTIYRSSRKAVIYKPNT